MQCDSHVLFEGDGYAIIWKPPLMHSAPLQAGGESLLTQHAQRFPDALSVRGRKVIEGGLLHRLDFGTRGLLVVAHRQAVYDRLWAYQEEGRFVKEYRALCLDIRSCAQGCLPAGFPDSPPQSPVGGFQIASAFRPWGPGRQAVRPVVPNLLPSSERRRKELSFDRGEPYTSEILSLTETGSVIRLEGKTETAAVPLIMVRARLCRGFRHQVRSHLAWLGLPLLGDPLYAPQGISLTDISTDRAPFFLEACAISFPDSEESGEKVHLEYESPFCMSPSMAAAR